MRCIAFLGVLIATPALAVPGPVVPPGSGGGVTIGTTAGTAASALTVPPSVVSSGMVLNGSTNDTSAFQAAKTAAPSNSIVTMPHGDTKITAFPTGSNPVLWYLNGTTFNGGSPLNSIGTDSIETILNGGRYYARGSTLADEGPVFRLDDNVTNSGGTLGDTVSGSQTNCTISDTGAALNDFVWCNKTILSSQAIGPGQHVGVSALAVRPATALSDGQGARSETWAGYFENNDQTNAASSTLSGSQVGIEDDIYANGTDPNNYRIILQMNAANSTSHANGGLAAVVGTGISIGVNDTYTSYNRFLNLEAPFNTAGIDLSLATPVSNAPAIQLGNNERFAWTNDGNHYMSYVGTGSELLYAANGTVVDTWGNDGSFNELGTLSIGRHVISEGAALGNVPVISACGTGPTLSATGDDRHGTVTPGSGATTCTLTWNTAYGATPDVILTGWTATTVPFVSTVSTAALTVGFGSPGKFTYMVEQ